MTDGGTGSDLGDLGIWPARRGGAIDAVAFGIRVGSRRPVDCDGGTTCRCQRCGGSQCVCDDGITQIVREISEASGATRQSDERCQQRNRDQNRTKGGDVTTAIVGRSQPGHCVHRVSPTRAVNLEAMVASGALATGMPVSDVSATTDKAARQAASEQ